MREAFGDGFQITLICRVDDGVAAFGRVVFLLQLNIPLLEAGIGDFFFGTGQDADAFGGGSVAGFEYGAPNGGRGGLLSLEEVEGVAPQAGPSVAA
jgi:hypothetical protein